MIRHHKTFPARDISLGSLLIIAIDECVQKIPRHPKMLCKIFLRFFADYPKALIICGKILDITIFLRFFADYHLRGGYFLRHHEPLLCHHRFDPVGCEDRGGCEAEEEVGGHLDATVVGKFTWWEKALEKSGICLSHNFDPCMICKYD